MIRCDRLRVERGGVAILDDVTVEVAARRIAVVGANGSGKSTLARVLTGLVRPDAGTVTVHGVDVCDTRRLRPLVGLLLADPDAQILLPTPEEDIDLSLRRSGLSRRERATRVDEALTRFGLAELRDRPAYALSGGQKQLAALAATLVRRPAVVIADEPTTMLDLRNARRVGDALIESLEAQLVVVTHDLALAERCDVALHIDRGRLVDVGHPADVIAGYRSAAA